MGSDAISGQMVSELSWQGESKGDLQGRSTQKRSVFSLHRKEKRLSIKARPVGALMRVLCGKPKSGGIFLCQQS